MISGIDIRDIKALYELKKGDCFKLAEHEDNSDIEKNAFNKVFKLTSLDGTYSFCIDNDLKTHHFRAWAKVLPVDVSFMVGK